jgi:uncharacterized protein YjbI with pentapeptide repeats
MISQSDGIKDQDASKNQESDKKELGWVKFLEIPSIKLIAIPISKSLLVPIILAGVAGWITLFNNDHQQQRAEKSNQLQRDHAEKSNQLQRDLADKKQRDTVLTQYIQNMKEFLLDKDHPLRESKENDVRRDIARALTKTTLQQLPSKEEDKNGQNTHKASVLSFLSLSGLIKTPKPIVMLGSSTLGSDMDFSGAYLPEGYLEEAALSNVNLRNANLTGAYLNRANLAATRLDNANLKNAQLINANLSQADLKDADLSGANISGANFINAENLTNKQIKAACNWEEAVYTEADENLKAKDPEANQKKIQEIKNDKASDPSPSQPVDCSQWQKQGPAID